MNLAGQTWYGNGGNIPDNGNSIDFTIQVQGLTPSTLNTSNFGLESVCINITHTWVSDLDIRLIAPDGTSVVLTSGNGGSGQNYSVTCFNNNVTNSIINGSAPFNGIYRPQGWLGNVNNGQNGNGTWKLSILDTWAWADAGTLVGWNITFGNQPSGVFQLINSDIPIVIINSGNVPIPDEPKMTAQMGIIFHGYGNNHNISDPFNNYNGTIGIEMRGSSSQMFPKKSYDFETRDASGNNLNVNLLDMPKENDWVLIANYSDKTLFRNTLTYDYSRYLGFWAPRTRFCEVVVNGEYQGVYALMEAIKRDDDRVNISELSPNSIHGNAVTGGYIIKIDKWTGSNNDGWESSFLPVISSSGQKIHFQYHYPQSDIITNEQKTYIQNYMYQFESTLSGPQFNDPVNGYYRFINMNSFADFFILNELGKNVDGYRLSTFLFKDNDNQGGKLTMGPVWDFDLAYRNADYCGGYDHTGWAYEFGNVCPGDGMQIPFWWERMLQDTVFTNTLSCRWQNLRLNQLDTVNLFHYIDSLALLLNQGQQRNFFQWPILGFYVWPNPSPIPLTWQGEIENLKKWMRNRIYWLDNNIPGHCPNVLTAEIDQTFITVYPNPADDIFVISSIDPVVSIEMYDISGLNVYEFSPHSMKHPIKVSHLPQGIYLLHIRTENNSYNRKIVIQR